MLSFQFFMSIIFVEFILSSSQIALNGLQNVENIENLISFERVKSRGGDFFLNMSPVDNILTFFIFIVFFLPSIK